MNAKTREITKCNICQSKKGQGSRFYSCQELKDCNGGYKVRIFTGH